ncbi:cupin [Synechococcus sp. HJ21-Hayes]|uniref:cupin n=1 Tax=unclassified Synechococcus TaxID=2626047 RepID=UPI0020CDFC08|nr:MULTISPECIES: cupin [unclassified Synechococcus]MCP9831591.1 cupin [Synechococcus sp. JJ3a-Johnson]MCP9852615.1 cupin [Synechococcus sp. HJ21-Hayes]
MANTPEASPVIPAAPASSKALLFDYRQAANPVRRGLTEPIPYRHWGPELHATGPSAVIPLDLSEELGINGPATSPALAAHFLRIEAGEGVKAAALATSSLFYVLSGRGRCERSAEVASPAVSLTWQAGDLFVLPAGAAPLLEANATSVLYWVNDAPLLHYLGVQPSQPRFEATHYPADWLLAELEALAADPSSAKSNRLSLLLANRDLPSTRTVTHVLWAMLGMVPAGATQGAHRHQSVALDLIVDCDPGCYTLVGRELNPDGTIRDPERIDWESGGAFITPPGHWHAHVNESGRTALLLPIQDAGLHTQLRSLDIRFT